MNQFLSQEKRFCSNNFCTFDESINFEICDVIIDITTPYCTFDCFFGILRITDISMTSFSIFFLDFKPKRLETSSRSFYDGNIIPSVMPQFHQYRSFYEAI